MGRRSQRLRAINFFTRARQHRQKFDPQNFFNAKTPKGGKWGKIKENPPEALPHSPQARRLNSQTLKLPVRSFHGPHRGSPRILRLRVPDPATDVTTEEQGAASVFSPQPSSSAPEAGPPRPGLRPTRQVLVLCRVLRWRRADEHPPGMLAFFSSLLCQRAPYPNMGCLVYLHPDLV